VDVTGRIGSLLEVGTGFHEDLSGRENTYLNGVILGMNTAEIDRKFDEIVAFAEVDRFIDTPVKHYSSGMYMRLAFAVAAHLETEILVVDEVLAVGDVHFQKKCLGKMDDIARHGRTVLFISHNMEAIQRLCTRGLLMDRGRLSMSGPIAEVVAQYRTVEQAMVDVGRFNTRSRSGTGWARVRDIRLVDERGDAVRGQPLLSLMNVDDDGVELPSASNCTITSRLPGPTFIPGRYRLNVFVGIPFLEHVDEIPDAFEFEIVAPARPWRPYQLHITRGLVCRKAQWACVISDPQTA
jgi:ABC-type multidrug transport system ATPase subunit